jgi:AraC-like DNA-binding protein
LRPILEVSLRGAAIALLLLLAALLLRDARQLRPARYGALYALGVAATMVVWAPPLAMNPTLWLIPLRLAAFGNSAMFLLVATALFDDEFAPTWYYPAAWLALVALGFGGLYGGFPRLFLAMNVLGLLLIFLGMWRALEGRPTDLVEPRRRFRVIFVVSLALYVSGILISSVLLRGGQEYSLYSMIDPLGTTLLTFGFAMMQLSVPQEGRLLSSVTATERQAIARASDAVPVGEPTIEREDSQLLGALLRLMDEDKVYREEALTIGAVAGKLGIPEYRLRRLINQRLGHRNFSAFLNGYRLADAMKALADPSQARVPILTIALDAGFQSIGPFNRAFKDRAGITPSEFRRKHLGYVDS